MFRGLSLGVNLLLFAIGAGLIWWAGTRLERVTGAIARRVGIGSAFAGLILLAAVTSLPEFATTVTAVLDGNVELAVHNIAGGVAFQVVLLAVADVAVRRGPLTRFAPSFGLLIEGVGLVFMLTMAIAGLALAGDAQFAVALGPIAAGVNPVMLALLPAYVAVIWLTRRAEGTPRWRPLDPTSTGNAVDHEDGDHSGSRLGLTFAGFAVLILAGGWAAASLADAIAVQTGLGSGLVGATLLAAATSLPEISTTVAAVRHGNEGLAVSNIFGSNSFDISLLSLISVLAADAFSAGPSPSAIFIVGLGAMLTCVYLWGLLEHSNRSLVRVGIDSLVVVALYLTGLAVLYGLS